MNDSLLTADRIVHLKIVMISLVAAITVVIVGANAKIGEIKSAQFQTASVAMKGASPLRADLFVIVEISDIENVQN